MLLIFVVFGVVFLCFACLSTVQCAHILVEKTMQSLLLIFYVFCVVFFAFVLFVLVLYLVDNVASVYLLIALSVFSYVYLSIYVSLYPNVSLMAYIVMTELYTCTNNIK
jgi:hypothetical protein